jgi:hypothetical protein
MSPVGFEPAIPASTRPQTYALDRAATGIGFVNSMMNQSNNCQLYEDDTPWCSILLFAKFIAFSYNSLSVYKRLCFVAFVSTLCFWVNAYGKVAATSTVNYAICA